MFNQIIIQVLGFPSLPYGKEHDNNIVHRYNISYNLITLLINDIIYYFILMYIICSAQIWGENEGKKQFLKIVAFSWV